MYARKMVNWAIKLGLLGALGIVVLIWLQVYLILVG
tara:strand:- start:294 stop:401 length:108 start_codon:yes stop_codon:yes gene_type:complete